MFIKDQTIGAWIAELRALFDTKAEFTPSETIHLAKCEIVKMRDFEQTNRQRIQKLDDELISRGAEIHRLAEELKSRTAERDYARQEWYAWMKLAVGNGVSLGEAHMPPIKDIG